MIFVKQQRMKKAQFFLAETDLPIKVIGDKVGYPDPYIFPGPSKPPPAFVPDRTVAEPSPLSRLRPVHNRDSFGTFRPQHRHQE